MSVDNGPNGGKLVPQPSPQSMPTGFGGGGHPWSVVRKPDRYLEGLEASITVLYNLSERSVMWGDLQDLGVPELAVALLRACPVPHDRGGADAEKDTFRKQVQDQFSRLAEIAIGVLG
eukprot:SAG11_NODE_25067_length_364_cov_0.766038_1_plen_117_part_10